MRNDDERTRNREPARALAAGSLALERTLSHLVNQAYSLTPRRNRPHVANRPAPNAYFPARELSFGWATGIGQANLPFGVSYGWRTHLARP